MSEVANAMPQAHERIHIARVFFALACPADILMGFAAPLSRE